MNEPDEETLLGLWRRASQIAGQQIRYPETAVLAQFALLITQLPQVSVNNPQ